LFAQDEAAFVSSVAAIFRLVIDPNRFITFITGSLEHWREYLLVDVREYLKGIVNVFVCFIDIAGCLSAMVVLVGELLRCTW
jgi:hypothetical protein